MPESETYQGAREALAALKPTLEALPSETVVPFRMSVPIAVANVLAVARSLDEDVERFKKAFREDAFNPDDYADLRKRGLALWQADADYQNASDPERKLPVLAAQGAPLRKKLLRAAEYLWGEDEQHGSTVAAIRSGRGHVDTADDLLKLASFFEDHWASVADSSAVTADDLQQSRRLAEAMADAISARPDAAEVAAARDLKDRAATHAQAGVDAVRNAALFIYGGDTEKMVRYPTIFTGRGD